MSDTSSAVRRLAIGTALAHAAGVNRVKATRIDSVDSSGPFVTFWLG